MKIRWIAMLIIFVALACNKDGDQVKKDRELIEQHLEDHNLVAQHNNDGLYYIIESEGTGEEYPSLGSTVKIHYSGYFLDGSVFESTDGRDPLTIPLFNTIRGWQQGIPLFKKNGIGKLFIPSHLGYGKNGVPGIPGNTVLIYDIELVGFY